MNNIRKLIFKFLIILLIIIVIIRIDNITKSNKNNTDFQWMAKYIWIENENFIKTNETNKNPNANTWVCFRKNFKIKNKKDIKNVIAKIAVDSKYWLYINGNIVIRDGQLKRGEKENSIYYDEIDISNYLEKGENNISILVWYFGKDSFSHIDSGQGALLFQSQIGNNLIISDQTWKATKNPAFLNDNELQNGRLSEFNIYYNSNLELNNWINKEYDDTNWENAIVCGNYNSNIWGELIKRDIPQFKYSDIKKYINSDEYENKTFEEDTIIEMKLKNNIQLVPYFKIDSKSNEKIIISNNKNLDNTSYYGKVTYITKNGDQQYESPSWINGDEIYYYIPKGKKWYLKKI